MGVSKFFLLGQQNTGATNFKDYITLSSAPSRPLTGKIRTWIDSLGIFNFLPASGPAFRSLIGSQGTLSSPGGNTRGQDATDLQFSRQSEDQVASGVRTFIGGGQNNQVVAENSFIAGGSGNIVNDVNCFTTGSGNNVAGPGSFASGYNNNVEGETVHAEGYGHQVFGNYSHAEGIDYFGQTVPLISE